MNKSLPITLIVLLIIIGDGVTYLAYQRQSAQNAIFSLQTVTLQSQLVNLQSQISALNKQNAAAAISLQEVANRQVVQQKSQSQLVTTATAKVVPAVVSVVISQNVPQYKIVYENPFGNDPFFQNVGMQIPVYQQTGGTKSQEVGAGSGFIINQNGYILTNKHVVSTDNASYTVLLSTGKQKVAKVIYRDPKNDIAIIKIDSTGLPNVSLGDSGSVQLGQTVIAIGNALGKYNNSVSVGVISGLNRTIQASDANGNAETLAGVIQTDAAINPGNSGGPLVDLNGNIVGINVATVQGSNNIGFAIPIDEVKNAVNSVIK